ncbi:tubulin-specific chaperone A isoform X2 [Rissa tridactyla]|uniref:tubulin-specific chaperone A isoform X2 n=2 Tax=Laridae TaxID=8910 RepID=UPI0023BAC1C3|nr:tubulin-specific chaperone A isoform X2 [Rissa tridactyla]
MADPRLRQIKIKTGVVRRLAKEKVMYEKEARQQEEKIEKMKAEACDDYGIKKQPLHEHQHDCRSWNLDNSTCIISAGVNTFWIPDFMLRIKGTCAVFGIEILQESRMMIPDCQRRLEAAHADLTQLLENEKELEEAEEYKEARSILESVKLEA